jgi:uncharacterized iron-regulated membrane protein
LKQSLRRVLAPAAVAIEENDPVPSSRPARFLRSVHRWIAVSLMVLLIPISLSGAFLVWHDEIDAMVHPGRYAVTGSSVALPPSAYLANATAALERGVRPVAIRLPAGARPVTVTARGGSRAEGGPPRAVTVYLDPPSGRVLDVVDFRGSLVGTMHRFHENLTIPEYSGRQIAGWAGVGMLILSLTGLWLWWPRNGAVLIGLRWRRSPATTANIHHLVGFWISLPLALVSATGIYLAFPQTARNAMSSITAMAPQAPRPGAQVAREVSSKPDEMMGAALAAEPGSSVAALFTAAPNPGGDAPVWRVQLRRATGGGVTVLVDDRTRTVSRAPEPLAGDRAAQMIRWIHEGEAGGPLWRVVVFLCGVMPSALGITGLVVWLRGRRQRRLVAGANAVPQPAE